MSYYGERFIVTHMEGYPLSGKGKRIILVDRETGVNYIFVNVGYAGGMTPLLDADGKPIVTDISGK